MANAPDLINRDPNNLNHYIHVAFEDVLGEPTDIRTISCNWKNSYKCFNCTRKYCYIILSVLFGILTAFYWGCVFAYIAFVNIWCCTPYIRYLVIYLHPLRQIHQLCLSAFCAPFFETCGLCCSRIHYTSSTGEPPKPYGVIPGHHQDSMVKSFK